MTFKKRRSRRDFIRNTFATSALLSSAGAEEGFPFVFPQSGKGANDRVNIGIIGLGSISRSHIRNLKALSDQARITAVCDIYKPRLEEGVAQTDARGYHDYGDLIEDKNVDAVILCTPDHWHAQMAIDAMRAGKDVDVEKPMSKTIEEARQMVRVAEETGRVLAVDSEHVAHGIWKPAEIAVRSGVLGKILWSQTSRSRNTGEPPWNYRIDPDASPANLDWDRFLGPAPKRPFDKERFFRWRKYWDYSGGIATDLYVHHIAPLLKVLGPEFPVRVTASGGNWKFPTTVLEVPDTFFITADFPSRHSLVVGGSLANSVELPIVIRGDEANILFYGPDHRRPSYLLLEPEGPYIDGFQEKVNTAGLEGTWSEQPTFEGQGRTSQKPVFRVDAQPAESFIENFLGCVRSRETPVLDGRLGSMVQVIVSLAVESHRTNRVLFFDPEN